MSSVADPSRSIRSRYSRNLLSDANDPAEVPHLFVPPASVRIFAISVFTSLMYFTTSGGGHFSMLQAARASFMKNGRLSNTSMDIFLFINLFDGFTFHGFKDGHNISNLSIHRHGKCLYFCEIG